jgi:drug/metabolite transporter (DMT)-like permease
MQIGVVHALVAAALFGASTPLAKLLVDDIAPVMLAGLLYLGSGIGLLTWWLLRRLRNPRIGESYAHVRRQDLVWLAGATVAGGVLGPILLMAGLVVTPATSASLLLNMEGVLTALLAWFVFKENFDRRIAWGMTFIVAGGAILSWQDWPTFGVPWGALAIVGACIAWAIDNNLTRKIAAGDAAQIAGIKGLVAGIVNVSLGLVLGSPWPSAPLLVATAAVGLAGYGLSLVFFVIALRHLGTARTGAYFSVAPFVGAVVALALLREAPAVTFWIAASLMVVGVWLHLTERHEHEHIHTPLRHTHPHSHDAHHGHVHDFAWDGREPHTHEHVHEPMSHSHEHVPDIHHRHPHPH